MHTKYLFTAFLTLVMISCSSGPKTPLVVLNDPIRSLIDSLRSKDYSIVLNDMDITEDDKNIIYRHKYIIIEPQENKLTLDSTGWRNVNEDYFMKHEKNLGMELVSNHDGRFSQIPKPVGFDWAVGNEKYGEWAVDSTQVSGNKEERQWRYHSGSSYFLLFWMFSRPTSRGMYGHYSNTARGKKAYYGSGSKTYGTNSTYQKAKRSQFYSRKKTNTSWTKTYTSRKSKSSSRFKGASSTRKRSGGFGK